MQRTATVSLFTAASCAALFACASTWSDGGSLEVEDIRASLNSPGAHTAFVPESPLGLPPSLAEYIPADNPMTPAKVELGRQLYFDRRLSRDNTVSCATCHDPNLGWTDQAPVSTGIEGQTGGRSAPTVVNRILGKTQFWDGRAASLEEQAVGPIANPIEMGFTLDEAVDRLNAIEGYRIQFEAIFGGPATADRIGKAIATFERTVLAGANLNDYYEQARPWFDNEPDEDDDPEVIAKYQRIMDQLDANEMSDAAWRGRELFFGKASCSQCHVGYDLTDEMFHNIGVGMDKQEADKGREDKTGKLEDRGAFKTPGLRNIKDTAPYMHDGSLQTLMEVVEHYDQGGIANPQLSSKIFKLNLTQEEKEDLVTFMEEALDSEVTEVESPRLPR